MNTCEFSLSPVGVPVLCLYWIPWFHSLVFPLGAHRDPFIPETHSFLASTTSAAAFALVSPLSCASSNGPNLKTAEVKILSVGCPYLQEITSSSALDVEPLAFACIFDCAAQVVSNVNSGIIDSAVAAISSVKYLHLSNGDLLAKASLPPWTIFIIQSMDASKLSLAPIGVPVGCLDGVPWFHSLILPLRTHGDCVLLEGDSSSLFLAFSSSVSLLAFPFLLWLSFTVILLYYLFIWRY